MEKRQNIQSASLVDLKAELYRKQEEFKQQKLKTKEVGYIKPKTVPQKNDIWSKKNAGVLQRAQRDFERKTEEENVMENSKKSLEAKARMYEKMTQGSEIPEEDGSKMYLVDFQKKVIDKLVDDREKDREKRRQDEEDELRRQEEEILSKVDIPPPASEDEEWVDYVDAFGRTRTCLKKDLKDLIGRDKKMTSDRSQGTFVSNQDKTQSETMPTLMSEDMRREIQRQKWEEEAQANLNGPVHYSNVQFDEIRSHGTGYFKFNKSEEIRQEQLETLGDLRKQTIEERSRRERLKEKRKAMLDARLAKVKQRKLQKEGGGLFGTKPVEDEENPEKIQPDVKETNNEKKPVNEEPQLLTRDENIKKDKPIREWDKGKDRLLVDSEEKYFQERRNERKPDFAPPSFYYSGEGEGTSGVRKYGGGTSEVFRKKQTQKIDTSQQESRRMTNEFAPPSSYNFNIKDQWKNNISTSQDKGQKSQNVPVHEGFIEDFLKRERTAVSSEEAEKVPQKTDINESSYTDNSNRGKGTYSDRVENIPLPGENTTVSASDEIGLSHRDSNTPASYSAANYEMGGFIQTDVRHLYTHVPPIVQQSNPASSVTREGGDSDHVQDSTYMYSQRFPMYRFNDWMTNNKTDVQDWNKTCAVQNITQHSYSHHTINSYPPTTASANSTEQVAYDTSYLQYNEQVPQVVIPKSSIVDTRLIKNADALHSYNVPSTKDKTDIVSDTLASIDQKEQPPSSSSVSSHTASQSVFSGAPVVYSQSVTYVKTEDTVKTGK